MMERWSFGGGLNCSSRRNYYFLPRNQNNESIHSFNARQRDSCFRRSPASVYRVLKANQRLDRRKFSPSKKGTGFVQPLKPHEHWHIDVSYINVEGTFYYLTSVLDGCSRAILHWELRESMTEQDVEVILQKAIETYPSESPRIISDNGPQFIARDFKDFIRLVARRTCGPAPTIPNRTERSNAGTAV